MKPKISPSMMCADLFLMRETLEIFEKTGIDYLHKKGILQSTKDFLCKEGL